MFLTIYNSQNSMRKAKIAEVYTEMRSIESAVAYIHGRMMYNDSFELQPGKHYDEFGTDSKTYIIYGTMNHYDAISAKELGISDLKRDYIVNYEEGTFVLRDYVDIQGTKVRTMEQVEALLKKGD